MTTKAALLTEITIDDQEINLVNIDTPRTNTEQQHIYKSLHNCLTTDDNNIIGGDFNSISDPKHDRLGRNPNARKSANNDLTDLTAQFQLTDI